MTQGQRWIQQLWRGVFGDRLVVLCLSTAVLIDGLTWAVMSRLVGQSTSLVPLHYTIYFGPDLIVRPRLILFLPAVGALIIIIMNWLVSPMSDDPLWRRTVAIISLTLNALLLAVALTLLYVGQA